MAMRYHTLEIKEKSWRTQVEKVEWTKPITQPPKATFPHRIDDATTAEQKPTDEPMCQIRLLSRLQKTEATRSRVQEAREDLWRPQVVMVEKAKPTKHPPEAKVPEKIDDDATTEQTHDEEPLNGLICRISQRQREKHVRTAMMNQDGRNEDRACQDTLSETNQAHRTYTFYVN